MPASTLTREHPIAVHPDASWSPAAPARRYTPPVVAMTAGVCVLALAAALVVRVETRRGPAAPAVTAAPAPAAAADPLAITLSARDVSVVAQVYEPGQESGWHSHPGIHAVAVLSGELTVYDGQCHAETYAPGRPYVGGQQLHLVRNETDAPVVMSVTYLNPSAPTRSTEHFPAPVGCPVS